MAVQKRNDFRTSVWVCCARWEKLVKRRWKGEEEERREMGDFMKKVMKLAFDTD